jgi:hypothetical protein
MHTEEGGGSVAASTAFMLGEIRSDVKNILLALPALRKSLTLGLTVGQRVVSRMMFGLLNRRMLWLR